VVPRPPDRAPGAASVVIEIRGEYLRL
jgi:hypothetical protein